MKKLFGVVLLCLMVFTLSACGANDQESSSPVTESSSDAGESKPLATSEPLSVVETSSASEDSEEPEITSSRQISVRFGENVVVYQLNDGGAAASFYEQLPLTIEVEDYSTNEKIFYPTQQLDTDNTPLAQGGAGTLAYYAPWGDVVMFYGDYNENPSLYELGQVVSGGELVGEMSGTITIDVIE